MIFDPLQWIRVSIDSLNTKGKCMSQGVVSKVMLVFIGLINFAAILLANVEAYRGRNISTEFSESRYIAFSMASILQILIVGIPLLALVQDNPSAKYFLETCIISIFCFSILFLIFIPKIIALRKAETTNHNKSENETRSSSINRTNRISMRSSIMSSR